MTSIAPIRMQLFGQLLRIALLALPLGALSFGAGAGADLPTGFLNSLVLDGFESPVALAFPSAGEMLVCEKGGTIQLVDLSAPAPTAQLFMTLPDVESDWERGLISIVLDPDYENNGWFYLYYQHGSNFRFRVSRFTRSGDVGLPNSELIIWQDNSFSAACCHFGGGLDFGPDGCLYLTTGEEFLGPQAADLTQSGGKIHRFFSDGTIPVDNPFHDGAGPNVDTIWAFGLRNPFRATWDLPTGRFFIGEVGGNTQETAQEDIHLGAAGANYGWPSCEGPCDNPDYPSCSCDTADDPIFSYDHTVGQAVVGGFVYRGSQYPAAFDGAYFYADYPSQWIRYLTFDATGTVVTGSLEFEPAAGSVTFLGEAPDGSIYYSALEGEVRRIHYESGNLAPIIHSATVSDMAGIAPFDVQFAGSASDPEGDMLDKLWTFGDGQQLAGDVVDYTYTQNGVYQARWVVSDAGQTTLSDPIEVRVGIAPFATIDSPADGSMFRAGDQIVFSGTATDLDGTLTPSDYRWEIFFLHNHHKHPAYGPIFDLGGSFTIPASGHDFSDDTGYEIKLTVTDADGLETVRTSTVYPDKVDITFDTIPTGLTLLLDGVPRVTPFVVDTLIDFEHGVRALPSACVGLDAYGFNSWSDGAPLEHTIVVPSMDTGFVASYDLAGSCFLPVSDGLAVWLKADFGIDQQRGSVSSWTDGSTRGNSLTAGGDPQLVVDGLGGHDYIALDGVQDEFVRSASVNGLPAGNQDRTMFAVVRYEEVAGGGVGYGNPQCNQGFALSVAGDGSPTVESWCPQNQFSGTATAADAGWMVSSVLVSDGAFAQYKNGAVIDLRSHEFQTVVDRILVGASLDGSQHRAMDVAEILVYDRALDENERLAVESYLQAEYFGQSCGLDDCNGNGVPDDCELLNAPRSMDYQYGDWIDIPDFVLFDDFTFECWVNFPAPITDEEALTCKLPAGQELSFPDGRLKFFSGGVDVIQAATPIVPDEWTHVAFSRTAGVLSIYINGVLDASAPFVGGFRPEVIGRGRQGPRTVGHLDEVRLWSLGRSAAETQADMGLSLAAPIPGLLGAWRFDGYLIDQTVLDYSGNGNHGTLGQDASDEIIDPIRDEELVAPLLRSDDLDMDGIPDLCQLGDEVCVSKLTAAGCEPLIGYQGTPSLSGPDNFRITGLQLPGEVSGHVLIGSALTMPTPPGGTIGGGVGGAGGVGEFQTISRVGYPVCIEAARATDSGLTAGTLGACDGSLSLAIPQAQLLALGYLPGDTLYAQLVFNDPANPDGKKGHTAALQFTLLP